jgi:hypothetical protein
MLTGCPVDELPDSDGAQLATVDAVVVDWLKAGVITVRLDMLSESGSPRDPALTFTTSVSALLNPSTCIPPWLVGLSFA